MFTSRGVSAFIADVNAEPEILSALHGYFLGTLDARLIAIDAATGERCDVFWRDHGEVDLTTRHWPRSARRISL